MSDLAGAVLDYFLSDNFDNILTSWASPVKVAYTAGLLIGLIVGLGIGFFARYGVVKAKKLYDKVRPKGSLPPLTEDQKSVMEDMLTFLQELLSANDNALFIGLKQFFKKEIEANEIKILFEIVSLDLAMADVSKVLCNAQFIAQVVRFLTECRDSEVDVGKKNKLREKMINVTRRCFKADILMMYAEDDYDQALDIAKEIRARNITVDMESEVKIGQPQLSCLGNVFIEYEFVFIISTNNLKHDTLVNIKKDMTTISSLYNAKKRVIPILTKDVSTEDADPVLRALNPLKYNGDKSIDEVRKLIEDAYEKIFIDE